MFRKESLGKKWRRRLFKFGKWMGISILTLVTAAYGYMRFDFVTRADGLEAEYQKALDFGLPLDPAEMGKRRAVPDELNAGPRYVKLAARLKSATGDEEWYTLTDPKLIMLDAESASAIRPYLNEVKPILADVRELSKLPECTVTRNWDEGWNVLFPEFAPMKGFARWLSVEAIVAAKQGDWRLANENLAAMGRIAVHAGKEPILIGCLVQVAIDSIVLNTASQMANLADQDVEQLAALKKTVLELPLSIDIEPYFQGEAFFGYWTQRNLARYCDQYALDYAENNHGSDSPFGGSIYAIFPPLIERDLVERANAADCLRYWNQVFRLLRETKVPPKNIGAEMDRMSNEYFETWKPWMKMNAVIMPVFGQAGLTIPKVQANRASVVALIDVLSYDLKNNRLPRSLSEAGAKVAEDYGDGTLRMVKTKFGFRVYSIGPDLVDDKGMTRQEIYNTNQSKPTDDLVTCYPASDSNPNYDVKIAKKRFFEAIDRIEKKRNPIAVSSKPAPAPPAYVQ